MSRDKIIAILITCHNRATITLRGLERMFEAASNVVNMHLDVFLVDDGSNDGTGLKVKCRYPEINLIRGNGNLFWSRGMHLAWQKSIEARREYDGWLWLNDDVELASDALQILIRDANATSWNGVIVGAFIDGTGDITYGVRENWRFVSPTGTPRKTEGDISGNCVLVPKSVFSRVGIISDAYFHSCGDFDYSARMRRANVPYYLASRVCGVCENEKKNCGMNSRLLLERVGFLFSAHARGLLDGVIYRYRNYGIFRAMVTLLHIPWLILFGNRK